MTQKLEASVAEDQELKAWVDQGKQWLAGQETGAGDRGDGGVKGPSTAVQEGIAGLLEGGRAQLAALKASGAGQEWLQKSVDIGTSLYPLCTHNTK